MVLEHTGLFPLRTARAHEKFQVFAWDLITGWIRPAHLCQPLRGQPIRSDDAFETRVALLQDGICWVTTLINLALTIAHSSTGSIRRMEKSGFRNPSSSQGFGHAGLRSDYVCPYPLSRSLMYAMHVAGFACGCGLSSEGRVKARSNYSFP